VLRCCLYGLTNIATEELGSQIAGARDSSIAFIFIDEGDWQGGRHTRSNAAAARPVLSKHSFVRLLSTWPDVKMTELTGRCHSALLDYWCQRPSPRQRELLAAIAATDAGAAAG